MKTFEHGGNIHKILRNSPADGKQLLDFSANINPLGPPEWLRPFISNSLENLIHYPDPDNTAFVDAISKHTDISNDHIVAANGTTELLYTITRLLSCKRAVIPVPSYVDYIRAAELGGMSVTTVDIREEDDFVLNVKQLSSTIQDDDLVIIATPNNPTGRTVDRNALCSLIEEFSSTYFLIDEAFLDFVDGEKPYGALAPNVMTMNSMTKFYGVPGLRIGYGIFPVKLAERIKENLPPWTVNSLAQAVGTKALQDTAYQDKTRIVCTDLRNSLTQLLQSFTNLHVYPGTANYLLVKMISGGNVENLAEFCLSQQIMIRKCDNYRGLGDNFFRVAVKNNHENKRLITTLNNFFTKKPKKNVPVKKQRSIMLQGTCSDAGKSIITAGLCRIFHQDGLKVAPFKSQNMSLNSFVTLHGDEMGRAQVVQAQAAKVIPDSRMNPVLLKPNSDVGSQIIVKGQPVGNMTVLEYNAYKPKIWQSVCASFDSLADEYEVVVLEGAGSPGEVNLKRDDIVNMKMAQYAEAPVLVVGDIDRGGVYASFVGIMEVLAEWERQLVAGFLVNKFRGQSSLLASAHDYVKMHTGRDVFGVIPYIGNLGLPEEDSVSFKKGSFNCVKSSAEGVEIAVISIPHISNFTDVEPFLNEPDVSLRIIEKAADLGTPQAIILPGSKNVLSDLAFLKSSGFVSEIDRCIENGCEVIGICGGYQMLGKAIKDPFEIESTDGKVLSGLGFLNIETVIEQNKKLTRKEGVHSPSGKSIFGYEIHHGVSTADSTPLIRFNDSTTCGSMDRSERIWGSYLHGIFDGDSFRRWFIDKLRNHIGISPVGEIVAPYDLEEAFDRLAACLRDNVDMNRIYKIMGL